MAFNKLKEKIAQKMKSKIKKLDPNDEESLREYSRTDENGKKYYRYPMGTYKRKGDRYIKEDYFK